MTERVETAMEAVAQLALSRPADDACMNISVLVVEDDFFQRGTLQQLFDRANRANEGSIYFEVRLLESTAEALSFLRSEGTARLDLVLLDVVFPGEEMSGSDLLPHIREAAGERTAIVMLSSLLEPTLVEDCIRGGADAYLPKPIRAEEVGLLWQHCVKRGKKLPPQSTSQPSTTAPSPRKLHAGSRPVPHVSPNVSPHLAATSGYHPSGSIALDATSRFMSPEQEEPPSACAHQ